MQLERSPAVSVPENEPEESCYHYCIWYEPKEENGSCQNRCSFICEKHRAEVFGRSD